MITDYRDDGQAAHQLELEQQEIAGYACPFCGTLYSLERSNCDGSDLACCSESGHCEPVTQYELERTTF